MTIYRDQWLETIAALQGEDKLKKVSVWVGHFYHSGTPVFSTQQPWVLGLKSDYNMTYLDWEQITGMSAHLEEK